MRYFISDLHFNHEVALINYKRPFSSVEEMNESIIDNWNNAVGNKDTVYLLGDVAFGSGKTISDLVSRLNGRKHLIAGNWDSKFLFSRGFDNRVFKSITSYNTRSHTIEGYEGRLILSHYPFADWDSSHKGTIHLHGHIHNRVPSFQLLGDASKRFMFNVSLEVMDYRPQTLEEIMNGRLEEWVDFIKSGKRLNGLEGLI